MQAESLTNASLQLAVIGAITCLTLGLCFNRFHNMALTLDAINAKCDQIIQLLQKEAS